MKILNVPITNVSELKKSPRKVIDNAKKQKNGVYIFNRNHPEAVVVSVKDYEQMVNKICELEDQLLDYKVEKIAGERIKKDHKGYSEKEVFGPNGLDDVTENEDDGWE